MNNNTSDFFENGSNPFEKEEQLIQEIQGGDPRAFKHLMREYFKELAGFAYQYVKSSHTAKDVVQDVFANIWERRSSWNPTQSLKMYLYQSVKNEALKHVRDQKTEQKYIEAYIEEQEKRKIVPKEMDEPEKFKQAVQRAIQELPERARMAYKLHRRDGLTYKEIAQVMEISHKTVESQIGRALKILRDQLSSFLPILILYILLEPVLH
ncbi:RNA polymerase sigma-70 factor [Aliifodinibius sp. S!AR15-10]|uniref:RNA polymerase sigma factor n=1 Tax=Aliifodinibius sp. S!AR15-10 TaxID=2950437 RepID=UPI002854EA26|nr:RNA polymerase sigma-70 factor [Aliifodinibius sp. S!AR15-10]MDR8393331.1 RNA polymerase sigma-70 factor [Aliifodinibius sp. S!AR15-10]